MVLDQTSEPVRVAPEFSPGRTAEADVKVGSHRLCLRHGVRLGRPCRFARRGAAISCLRCHILLPSGQIANFGLAGPVPFHTDSHELLDRDDAVVRFDMGLVEQALRALAVGDGLAMAEGIHEPLDRGTVLRSEEHPSELQSLMRISYAVFS